MRIERLGDLGSAPAVLRAVAAAADRRGLAPPAALIGEWFGSGAVIAPSVTVSPVAVGECSTCRLAPAIPRGRGGWFGYLSYPDAAADGRPGRIPEAAGGWTDCVLRQDGDGHWWYESLSGAALSEMGCRGGTETTAAERLRHHLGGRRSLTLTGGACSTASRPSPRARSTRRACARSSRAGSTAHRSISSSTPWNAHRLRGRRFWRATGVRWRRCRRSCFCDAQAMR